MNLCSGTFTNTGTVTHTGSARDLLAAGQLTSTGTISSQAGVLMVLSGSPAGVALTGGSIGGGAGQVLFDGTVAITASVGVGDNVWVIGTMSGTATVPAGVTLHVGYDPEYISQRLAAGTITGRVTGAGTLEATGRAFNNWPNGTLESMAVIAADLDVATVVIGDYSAFASKPDTTPTVIGNSTIVQIAGNSTLNGSVAVVNNGTVDITVGAHAGAPYGGIQQGCGTANSPSWLNAGTLAFSNNTGGVMNLCSGTFTNTGTVTHTGSARDLLAAGQLTSTGTISSQAGVLLILSGSPAGVTLTGGGVGGGTGQVLFDGTVTTTPSVLIGNNVWVIGTMDGTAVIADGATVHIGYDPEYISQRLTAGTITGTVTGPGTLRAEGHLFNNWPNGSYESKAVIAADLNTASVILGEYTSLATKPDTTPTLISNGTTVTVATTPTLSAGLTLQNHGTINFGTSGYFTCGDCTFINETDGTLRLHNPDGSFTHGFTINAGTFDNRGLIRLTGYLPGTWVWFGPSVTLTGHRAGNAVVDGLQQPTWIQNLQTSAGAAPFATALAQTGLSNLASNALMAAAAQLTHLGVGMCANVNASVGVAGASTGVCKIIDPHGEEAVVLSVSGGLAINVSKNAYNVTDVLTAEPSVSIDVGGQILWTTDPEGGNGFSIGDLDGLSWCQSGTLTPGFIGGTGQHCWGPEDGVPFALNTLPVLQPGVHSLYLGAVLGTPGFSTGLSLSYSVTIGCGQWYSWTLQMCSPANRTPPAITGTPAVGQTLTVDHGQWAAGGTGPEFTLTYHYQWQRCTIASQTSCNPINNTTSSSSSYTLTTTDTGKWITVQITATNTGGSSPPVTAALTGPIP